MTEVVTQFMNLVVARNQSTAATASAGHQWQVRDISRSRQDAREAHEKRENLIRNRK